MEFYGTGNNRVIKTRVIVVGDNSLAKTGYAIQKRMVLEELHGRDDVEVAELGFAGLIDHKNLVPWKYYPVVPDRKSSEFKVFESAPLNKQGILRWNDICLDFRPHYVLMLGDPWHMKHIVFSCLKSCYKVIAYPAIDSGPISGRNLAILNASDIIMPWTTFGKSEMEKFNLSCLNPIPVGITTNPIPKEEARNKLGLPNKKTYGFVCRNQPRKRLPELLEAFAEVLKVEDSILYLHTSCHDIIAWDLGRHLLRNKVMDNVYFTYMSDQTKQPFCLKFNDFVTNIGGDPQHSAHMCGSFGFFLEDTSIVYSAMDWHIQCASCEGFGMPIMEAAACGVPTIGIGYSATKEVVENCGGIIVEPDDLYFTPEPEIDTLRASIPIDKLVEKMLKAPVTPIHYYTKDKSKKAWKTLKLEPHDFWQMPDRKYTKHQTHNQGMAISTYLSRCNETNYHGMESLYQTYIDQGQVENLAKSVTKNTESKNRLEQQRVGKIPFVKQDWMY